MMIYLIQIQDSIAQTKELKSLQLQKLYEPEPVAFTFETIGWKVLAVVLCIILVCTSFILIKKYIKNAYRRRALKKLEEITSIVDALIILKKVAIQTFDRNKVGNLYGAQWLEFLDQTGKKVNFSSLKKDIETAIYTNDEVDSNVRAAIILNSKKWIKTHAR
ncbi:DUF4381 domain-containing protein [Mesonia aquimarina]|uniref:DUF4381 domain-containing protein n=1 Tax=Mesonia aquimarina TaxID=1504967 RepID=UPI000EF5CCAF|nr:DUF4381 domain-containing protein [Mesonia aquimarina]